MQWLETVIENTLVERVNPVTVWVTVSEAYRAMGLTQMS